jgi:hypothetical protein
MELTKDVTVSGTRYQIGRMKAKDGSWVLAQVMTKMLPAALENGLAGSGAQLAANRAQISEDEFANIQAHALAVVRRYENGLPVPVFVRPDRWAAKDLEYDLVAVMALTVHSIVFTLSPFFSGDGMTQLLESFPGLPALSSPATNT